MSIQSYGITLYDPPVTEMVNNLAGGLRIKKIENYDNDNTLLLTKDYNYDFPELDGISIIIVGNETTT